MYTLQCATKIAKNFSVLILNKRYNKPALIRRTGDQY